MRRGREIICADVCTVYLTEQETGEHVLRATEGLAADSVGHVRFGLYEGLVGLVSERAEPVNLDDAPSHPRYRYISETGEQRFHGFLGVPIIQHRKVLGVLVVRQQESRRFDEAEVTLLVTLAAQLAGAIAHADISGGIVVEDQQHQPISRIIRGRPGAPGVAVGTLVVAYERAHLDEVPDAAVADIDVEVAHFEKVVAGVRVELQEMKDRFDPSLKEERVLFDAYLMMLDGDSLVEGTITRIQTGNWASGALRDTIQEHATMFESMEDSYLRERSSDIRDLGRRILLRLQSGSPRARVFPENTILVGEDLTATHLAEVPGDRLVGVISAKGSTASHVAILSKALGLPAVMGVADLPVRHLEGKEVIIDGYRGQVYLSPSKVVRNQFERLATEEAELSKSLGELRDAPAVTTDGQKMPMYINAGLLADISPSLESGAEGVGLYRTEIPFMIRESFPGEDSQVKIYRQVLEAFSPRPVVIRSLDIGGDKMLPYFPIHEENPFLGWRGIRVTLDHPEIFITQLRAMLKASVGLSNLHVMLPMVTSVDEVDEAMILLHRAYEELLDEGEKVTFPKLGVMIEVPSAVYQADLLARRVDFLSIGTNDLTQYLLAVDRNNAAVADLYDSLHPAMVRAVLQVTAAAQEVGTPVGVCGELAGDPLGAILLVAMGVDSLSMSSGSLSRVKKTICGFSRVEANGLLEEALKQEDPESIRELLRTAMEEKGLGGLVRAGI